MEILGYLEKVFYDGNSKLPGGKYTFTLFNIETGERVELKLKLGAKEEFIVGVIYRVEYDENDNNVYNMVLMYENINDFRNKIVSSRSYNYLKNPKQFKVQVIKYVVFSIVAVLVVNLIFNLIK